MLPHPGPAAPDLLLAPEPDLPLGPEPDLPLGPEPDLPLGPEPVPLPAEPRFRTQGRRRPDLKAVPGSRQA